MSPKKGAGCRWSVKVDGVQGQLSVTRQHKSTATAPFGDVKGRGFASELDEVALSDSGVYRWVVSEWKPNSKTHRWAQIGFF